jgi:hypothetical protein
MHADYFRAKMYKFLTKNVIIASAAIGILLYTGSVWAAAGRGAPVTRGEVEGDSARISFEWKHPGNFTAYLNDRDLTITFDRTVNPDFGSVLAQLYPYIVSAQRKADGKTITFLMDEPYRIRTFKSGTTNGVLLLGVDPERSRNYAAKDDSKQVVDPKNTGAPAALNSQRPTAGETASTEEPAKKQAEVVADTKAKPEPVTQDKKLAKTEEIKEEASADTQKTDDTISASEGEDTKEAVAEKTAEPEPKPEKESEPVRVSAEAKATATEPQAATTEDAAEDTTREESHEVDGTIKVSVSAAEDSATLRFPFHERTASAVFIRSGSLWIVFNKTVALDLSDFKSLPQTVIGKAELVLENGVSAIRMPVASTVLPTIAKEAGKYEWAVLLAPKSRLLSNALEVQVRTDPPAPPHVFIPALEMAETIAFKDPQVGDFLVITPLFNLGEGLMHRRDFIEFTLLETAQGIVVSKKADDVKVTQLRNGLRISPNQGITLTPRFASGQRQGYQILCPAKFCEFV